jgi:hypothetical protein
MKRIAALDKLGLPAGDLHSLPTSNKRFPDGGQFRIELPDIESPEQLKRVVERSKHYGFTVHRVSEDSGITLMTDEEIRQMAEIGRTEGIEVCLFIGPRAGYDIGAQAKAQVGAILGKRVRGMDQILYSIENVRRAADAGIRSFLIADEGLLWILNEMRRSGELPKESIFKVSFSVGQCNPASAKLLESIGAGTFNIPSDLSLAQIASIRQAINIPIDMYLTTPGPGGGFIRIEEAHEIVRVGAPIYLKFGVPMTLNLFPSGEHVKSSLILFTDEEVRLAKIATDLLHSRSPDLKVSPKRKAEPGIPVMVHEAPSHNIEEFRPMPGSRQTPLPIPPPTTKKLSERQVKTDRPHNPTPKAKPRSPKSRRK